MTGHQVIGDSNMHLDEERAGMFARIVLAHVRREYPNKLDHIMTGEGDVRAPRVLHPVFYGSFDWHSCVHGYWLLARLLRRYPQHAEAARTSALFNEQLTAENVEAERVYASHSARKTFERPYGWAWLLMLAAELTQHQTAEGTQWREVLEPLTQLFVGRFMEFLPKATYPIRAGTHFNTAFALTLAATYAEQAENEALRSLCVNNATRWYGNDRACQAWEPAGDDFLSPSLIEAVCMQRVLGNAEWQQWFREFLPDIATQLPATLFTPATVSDRTDAKIAHLDGLNLSRAWCWKRIASALPAGDVRNRIALGAAGAHLRASLPHLSADYAGEHWLATFALLALDDS